MLGDITAIAVVFVLPGWALGVAVLPSRLSAWDRLVLSLALAVPATVLVALPGLLADDFGVTSLTVCAGLLATVAAWRGRRAVRPFLSSLRSHLSTRGLGLRIGSVLAVAIAAGVAWLAVVEPLAGRGENPWPSGLSLYYWNLAEETVAAEGLPESLPEWGRERPFPVEYLATTVHSSVAAIVAGDAGLDESGPDLQDSYRIAVLVLTLLAAYALARRWLPSWWAFVAAVLALSGLYLSSKLLSYRPETVGFLLVLWSAWLLDHGIARRSRRWVLLAGVVEATSFLAHGSAWLIAPPIWLAIVVARLAPAPPAPGARARDRMRLAAASGAWALRPVALGAVVAVATVATVTLTTGTADRLVPLLSGTSAAEPDVVTIADDPTWTFFYLATYQPTGAPPEPPDLCGNLLATRIVRTPWEGVDLLSPLVLGGLAVALLALTVPAGASSPTRRVVLGVAVFVVGLYAVTESLCLAYDNFVPARAGPTRVLPYHVLGLALLLALVGAAIGSGLERAVRRLAVPDSRSGLPRIARLGTGAAVTTILMLVLVLPGPTAATNESGRLSEVSARAYLWIGEHLPQDAVVMTNGYTAGGLVGLSGRTGWLDGRAPYLESPAWLGGAIEALRGAREYFADPELHPPPTSVDYLLVADSGVNIGGKSFVTNFDSLRKQRDLRLVERFARSRIQLFKIVGDRSALASR